MSIASSQITGQFVGATKLSDYSTAFVNSITGTPNQVVASASVGGVTLSLPQSIHTAATPTFAGLTSPSLTYAGTLALSATGSNPITLSTNGTTRISVGASGTTQVNGLFTVATSAAAAIAQRWTDSTNYTADFGYKASGQAYFGGNTGTSLYLRADNTDYAAITAVYGLDVLKSGSSGTLRVFDQTATTGVTSFVITPGAAQGANPLLNADATGVQIFKKGRTDVYALDVLVPSTASGLHFRAGISGLANGITVTQTAGSLGVIKLDPGTGGLIGFFGATPVARPAALTAANAGTINSGDATTDTIIGNMRTRINELESKIQSLGLIN